MFKFIYEILIDPLGLPIHWLLEYIILLIINKIAYYIAFDDVGDLYNAGMDGKVIGSLLHYVFRTFRFILIWGFVYFIIWLCKWLFENRVIIASIIGVIVLLTAIVVVIKIIKSKTEKNTKNE